MRKICFLVTCAVITFASAQQPTHKVYVVDGVVTQTASTPIMGTMVTSSGEVHTAPGVITAILKTCPKLISLTTNQANAEYTLNPQMKGSTLANSTGDIVYVSPAIKMKNTAKDVCSYIAGHSH